eukprot:1781726-Pyramimonas_sp.AAC.1
MAPSTYYDLGFSFYGLRESRSSIDYFMTPQSLLPLVRRMYMRWRSHRRLHYLPRMLDHIPMDMEVVFAAPPPPRERGLAAGLEVGCARRDFLHDLRASLTQAAPLLATILEDENPSRRSA